MSTYILVHGALHGGWCWYKVAARLRTLGHRVLTPDLPGLGIDRTPVNTVTLKNYSDHLCELIENSGESVHLVAHSMGGIAITQAAEAIHEKVVTLTYLAAFLLPSGETVLEHVQGDHHTKTASVFNFSEDKLSFKINAEAARDIFFADCSTQDIALAEALLTPQSIIPMTTPIQTTPARWGSIPRAYIECTNDKALSPELQQTMYTRLPCERTMQLSTSHSPFFSAPEKVVTHLLSWTCPG